jgi:uncharacterized delta-60 repeat protein
MKSPTSSLLTLIATLSALSTQNLKSAEIDGTFAAQISGTVHALSVDSLGNVVAGGEFNAVNGSPRNNLVRLTASGTTDNAFTVAADGPVFAVAADSDDAILVAGAFNSPGRHLARIDSAGEIFALAIGTSTGGRIDCLALGTDGSVAFGGPFRNLNGSEAIYAGKLTPNGTIDSGFNSSLLPSMAMEAGVDAVALQADGKVIVGGNFATASGFAKLVRLNADGSVDASFSGNHGPMLYVKSITALSNGQLLVAGVANSSSEGFVRRLNSDGAADASFQAPNFSGSVEAAALDGNGGVIVGGSFDGGLVRLTSTGALDSTWNISTDGAVKALALQGNDAIVVGGSFRNIGEVSQAGIARIQLVAKSQVAATNTSGRFVARLQGEAGKNYEIESSSDLSNWETFGTATATEAGIEVSDSIALGRNHRFFRARLLN